MPVRLLSPHYLDTLTPSNMAPKDFLQLVEIARWAGKAQALLKQILDYEWSNRDRDICALLAEITPPGATETTT